MTSSRLDQRSQRLGRKCSTWRPSLIQPSWGESGGRLLLLKCIGSSGHLRRPTPLVVQVFCPAAAAVGEVLAMGDQALLQQAGEQRDAVRPRVMPKEVPGHADLVAAAGANVCPCPVEMG